MPNDRACASFDQSSHLAYHIIHRPHRSRKSCICLSVKSSSQPSMLTRCTRTLMRDRTDETFKMRYSRTLIGIFWICSTHPYEELATALSIPVNQEFPQPNATAILRNYASPEPDPRFRFKAIYGSKNIAAISLLMNAVNGLAILAHQPLGQGITGVPDIVLRAYQEVDIAITPAARFRIFDNKLAIWGLYGAMHEMALWNKFTEVQFDLFWEEINIATILITEQRKTQAGLNSSLDVKTRSPAGFSLRGNKGLRLGFQYVTYGSFMSYQEVFMTVLATLQILAYWSDSDVIYPFTIKAQGFHAVLQASFGGPPPKTGPYLLSAWVIDTVRMIPGYMLQYNRFADLEVTINATNVRVGDVLIYRPRHERSDALLTS